MTITPEQLVQREVIYCVSSLVHELAANALYFEELSSVLSQDDWEATANEAGAEYPTWNKDIESAQDYCEHHELDPVIHEAFEHWIVSGWLADKLEAKGEMILRDFLGLTIWGRSCTGQMIAADGVIEEICKELNKAA